MHLGDHNWVLQLAEMFDIPGGAADESYREERRSAIRKVRDDQLVATFDLVQPTLQDMKRYRPALARWYEEEAKQILPQLGGLDHLIHNDIGPFAVDGTRIWFGIEFYGGEGFSGVGGFGIFDTATETWSIVHHPILVNSSVSAIHPDGDVVWLGTYHGGEGSPVSTWGLVKYDRRRAGWADRSK